jgi:hypothetical protein
MEVNLKVKFDVEWDKMGLCGIINDYQIVEKLRKEYKILAEGIGTLQKNSKQNKLLTKPFLLNKYEVMYLLEKYEII